MLPALLTGGFFSLPVTPYIFTPVAEEHSAWQTKPVAKIQITMCMSYKVFCVRNAIRENNSIRDSRQRTQQVKQ